MNKLITTLYFIFLISLCGFSYFFVDANFIYLKNFYTGFSASNRILTTALYIGVISLFFILYLYFLRKIKKKELSKNNLLFLVVGSVVILLFSYPAMLSYDLFNYIATAKVSFFYFENPYVIMPIELQGDPMLLFTHAANKIALYGPLWIGLTAIPHFFGLSNYLLTIVMFKLFIALFYLGTVLIIWKISRNNFSVAFFALNPLVLIETLVSSHNDIVMVFLAILGFYFFLNKKIFLFLLFVSMSIFIKYATVLLLPIIVYIIWKTEFKKESINKGNLFTLVSVGMFVAFLCTPIREEIYPWYAIWFLAFVSFLVSKKQIMYYSIIFSYFLMFRYTPFMVQGFHYGNTPFIKSFFTFFPLFLIFLYEIIVRRVLQGREEK